MHGLRGSFARSWIAGAVVLLTCLSSASVAFGISPYQAPFLIADPDLDRGNPVVGDLDHDGDLDVVISRSVLHGNGDGTFDQIQSLSYSDQGPTSSALGDLNGDGWLDLAVLDPGATTIILNNGNGTFGPQLTVSGGHQLALGDLNGDGKLDLVTTTSSMTTRLGNGDGTFSPFLTNFPTPSGPWAVAVSDLNGDDRLDVLVSNNNWLSVFIGNGNNTFQPRIDYATGSGAFFVTTGDVNGDAHVDVVVACQFDNAVRIHIGNGNGTLQPSLAILVSPQPTCAVLADFDRDGTTDLAVGTGGGGSPSDPALPSKLLDFLPGNGDGSFGARVAFDIQYPGNGSGQIAAGQIDADSDLDVIVDNSVLLGNGDGTFGTYRQHDTGPGPSDLLVADVNHDSRSDIVSANSGASSISVLIGDGSGSFAPRSDFATASPPRRLAAADVNGDSHVDVLATGSGAVSVLLGTGTGTFPAHLESSVGTTPTSIATGDVNGDGKLDAVTGHAGSSSGSLSVLLGNGNGTFGLHQTYAVQYPAFDVALGDMNDDGKLDIVAGLRTTSFGVAASVAILLGNGNGTFGAPQLFPLREGGLMGKTQVLRLFDLNQDGDLDVIASALAVEVLLGNGDGSLQAATTVHENGDINGLTDLDIADFNGDGYADLASLGVSSIALLFGDGTGAFPNKQGFGCGRRPMALRVAPLDGNSTPDLVTAHVSYDRVRVLLDTSSLVGVPEPATPVVRLSLAGRPNPARSWIVLEIDVPRLSRVSLRVYDLAGRMVRSLAEDTTPAGRRPIAWDLADDLGRRVPAGVYLAVAKDGENEARTRVVVLR